jgi:hypothetical protein
MTYQERDDYAPPDGKLYRPSNGTEGDCFYEGWCSRCRRDAPFREGRWSESCQIVANSYAFEVNHPDYPKEWVWKGGEPVCTAFEDVDQPAASTITDAERAAQMPLL